MTGPSTVSPTSLNPEWDITLTDGTDTVGFILVDNRGNRNPYAIQRTPFGPRTALKMSQGVSKYDDLELPYISTPQDDWSGGRGKLSYDDDITRYWDGYRIDTTRSKKLLRGPAEQYGIGEWRNWDGITDASGYEGGYYWQSFLGTFYLGAMFTASANYNASQIIAPIKCFGTPGDLIVELRSDNSGTPGGVLRTVTMSVSGVREKNIPEYYTFTFSSNYALTSGIDYWVVFQTSSGTHNSSNHWEVACNFGHPAKSSTDGTNWGAFGVNAPYFRVASAEAEFSGIFFDYKGAKYFVRNPTSGADSQLYICGDRGVASNNAGNLSLLIDSTKSWTVNQWVGARVRITNGAGIEEEQTWRTITANTATTLTVSPAWTIPHNQTTEYVITSTNRWNNVTDISIEFGIVSGVAVTPELMFFALGTGGVLMAREYNNLGTWTVEAMGLTYMPNTKDIITLQEHDGTYTLWGISEGDSSYSNSPFVYYAKVPKYWGEPYTDLGEFAPTDVPWSDRNVANVTNELQDGHTRISIGSSFTTGIAAVKNLDDAVDLTPADFIGYNAMSSVTTSTNPVTLQLIMDDVNDLGEVRAPLKVMASRWYTPVAFYLSGTTYTTMTNATDGISATAQSINSMPSTDYIFIGYPSPFSSVHFDMNQTNSNASTMTLAYYDGVRFVPMTITDGTAVSGATLAQDGTVTFNLQDDWKESIVNNVEAYWVMLTVSATLDATVDITHIKVSAINQNLPHLADGNNDTFEQITLRTTDWLWICGEKPFNRIDVIVGATGNDTTATLSASYYNGSGWVNISIVDNTVVGGKTLSDNAIASITFNIPYDWQPHTIDGTEGYWIRFTPSADLSGSSSDSSVGFYIYTFNVARQNNFTANVQALTAGTWEWVTHDINPVKAPPMPDYTAIKSIGYRVNNDIGAMNLELEGDIRMGKYNAEYIILPTPVHPTKIIAYGSSVSAGTNPYIITEDSIYEIQRENDNAVARLSIGEMAALSGQYNGRAACVNDVYLYFNLGRKIERYYNNTMEDIGVDLDDGLPTQRHGEVAALLSYPGNIFAAIDAGSSGYSSIYVREGNGWCEIYRAPYGRRILSLGYQSIPGSNTGRLWFTEGGDLMWIGISTAPDTDLDYSQTGEGYIVTGWYYIGMKTIQKVFDSLTMLLIGAKGLYSYCYIEYQLDDEATWTLVSGSFDYPVEKLFLGTNRPTGRRIRFRVHLVCNNRAPSLFVVATVLDSYGIVPVKYQYDFTALLSELTAYDTNLEEQEQRALGYSDAAEIALAKLDAWCNNANVLTMNSRYSLYDNKTVILSAPMHMPIKISSAQQMEKHILNITCHDL